MKDQYLKRSEHNPGAILTTDLTGLMQYKLRKKKQKDLEEDINTLKEEMKLIKELLLK